jgi:hypothetical protein
MIWDPRWDSLDPVRCSACGEDEALRGDSRCADCLAQAQAEEAEAALWAEWDDALAATPTEAVAPW